MKYGAVSYQDSLNIGDDIQTYATLKYLPSIDYVIERERMDNFVSNEKEPVKVICAGWYLYNHNNWPPSSDIDPLLISMHFDTYFSKINEKTLVENGVLDNAGADWLRKYGVVGARDYNTCNLLDQKKIPAYFSGCITLTLDKQKDILKHNKVVLVDVPFNIETVLRENIKQEVVSLSHYLELKYLSFEKRMDMTKKMLAFYQGASLIITPRLHAALPCLALDVPVLFIKQDWAMDRVGSFLDFLHYTTEKDLEGNNCPYPFDAPIKNHNKFLIYREKLENTCNNFIQK